MKTRTKLFLSLLIGVALLHSSVLGHGFVWDDHKMIVENPGIRDLGNIPAMFRRNYFGERADSELYRPLVNVSLAADYALWGKDGTGRPIPLPFHLTNLLLHLVAGLFVYGLVRRLVVRPWLPEIAALLFLVHPASAEPVAWIVARGDLLAAILALAALHLHLTARRRPALLPFALLSYLAALFSKLSAAPLPLLVLLLLWVTGRLEVRRDLLRLAAYAIPAAIYLLVRSSAMPSLFPSGAGVAWRGPGFLPGLAVAGAVTFRLFSITILPAGLSADYSADPVSDPGRIADLAASPPVLLLAAAVPLLLAAAVLTRRRTPLLSLGVLWFFVALLPVSQAVRIGAVMADRFLYLPSIGIALALAAVLLTLPRHRIAALTLLLVLFSAGTRHREAVWRNDGTMRADVLAPSNYPEDADSWNWLGLWYGENGRRPEEIEAYRQGLRSEPGNRYLQLCLGAALLEEGRLPEARTVLDRAFRASGKKDLLAAKIAYHLARVLLLQDQAVRAAEVLEGVVSTRPPFPEALELLARIYATRLARPDRAAELRKRAAAIRDAARRAATFR